MLVKFRIQVDDQVCEADGAFVLHTIVRDLIMGRSKLRRKAVPPADIHITVCEAAPEQEVEQWRKAESK